ncbi:MAG: D-Ala-D-Ala carboxypeptidase family metallohydrolase [Pseudomonadota bacterium]
MTITAAQLVCRCCGRGAELVASRLLTALNRIEADFGPPLTVTSGYRCAKHNAEVGGSKHSAHLSGEAADISDRTGALKLWMTEDMLAIYGLWAEDYWATPNWLHIQVRPAHRRIFAP